ncbi:MAG: winged helix-turn-helix domain-containing protein [Chakrabartia sp.]
MIRRSAGAPTDQIVLGNIQLDVKARCAWRDGKCLALTRNEFRLLRLFVFSPDHPLSHADLIEKLNTDTKRISQNALEVLIGRLRRKIGADKIQTLRGIGYRFSTPALAKSLAEPEDCRLASCHAKNYKKY